MSGNTGKRGRYGIEGQESTGGGAGQVRSGGGAVSAPAGCAGHGSDVRSAEALAKEIPALLEENIAVEAGGHGLLTFRRQDLIVVSPGVPLNTPEIVQVQELRPAGDRRGRTRGPLSQRQDPGHHRRRTARRPPPRSAARFSKPVRLPVAVGGNIGLPVIALVEESREDGWSVLEVSSFQLETTVQLPSRDRGDSEHHARSPRSSRHLRKLRCRERKDLCQPECRRCAGAQCRRSA